ncbi:MAG TPA: SDR family oxidoreductase, partial [Blastocatellia bacterium]|nr:SDR family oxidoreductase [Blastocatellia bacterium]
GGGGGLTQGGVYLILGGMGKVGLMLARYLSVDVRAHVILVGRSELPKKDRWEDWIREKGDEDEVSKKIKKLMETEHGVEVEIKIADVCDEDQMRRVIDEVYERYGHLNGVIHAAGAAGEKVFRLIPEMDDEESRSQFESKVYGLYVLENVLEGREIDFCMLFSSNASILGGIGLSGYSSANLFMDAFAASRSKKDGKVWISANWDGWLRGDEDRLTGAFRTSMDQYAMTPFESVEAFKRVATMSTCSQVIVSTGDLFKRLDLWINNRGASRSSNSNRNEPPGVHARPALDSDYVAPSDEIQMTIARIWQEQLGIDRLGINDNFFELGGNSLIGLKIISLLRKELGVEIPIVALFEGPTVSALARVISSDGKQGESYEENRGRGERRRARRLRKPPAAKDARNT